MDKSTLMDFFRGEIERAIRAARNGEEIPESWEELKENMDIEVVRREETYDGEVVQVIERNIVYNMPVELDYIKIKVDFNE